MTAAPTGAHDSSPTSTSLRRRVSSPPTTAAPDAALPPVSAGQPYAASIARLARRTSGSGRVRLATDLQRAQGNQVARQLIGRATSSPGDRIQRMLAPLQVHDPKDRPAVIGAYARVIEHRSAAINRVVNDPSAWAKLVLLNDKMQADVASGDVDLAWKRLDGYVRFVNDAEVKFRQQGGKVDASVPVAMTGAEADALDKLFLQSLADTRTQLGLLQGQDRILADVFGNRPEMVQLAKEGLGAIATQLDVYALPDRRKVDRAGTLDAGGTVLQNEGRGKTSAATMTITRAWGALAANQRISALVHETSHGARTATEDNAYLGSWTVAQIKDSDALRNAPHWEGAMEIMLGLRGSLQMPLMVAPAADPAAESSAREVLGEANRLITRARLGSGSVLAELKASLASGAPVGPTTAKVGGVLRFPFVNAAQERATSADVELIAVLRDVLQEINRKLVNVTGVAVLPDAVNARIKYDDPAQRLGLTKAAIDRGLPLVAPKVLQEMARFVNCPNDWRDVLDLVMDLLIDPRSTQRLNRLPSAQLESRDLLAGMPQTHP